MAPMADSPRALAADSAAVSGARAWRGVGVTHSWAAALLAASFALPAAALAQVQQAPKTVCTVTVNSSDEREALRQHLPAARFQFVELVEHGRRDWLARACASGVRCDALVVSGHFDGADFFSDRLERAEYLPMAELERVSCSASCPALFEQLEEVYLFGCNTLNTLPMSGTAAAIVEGMVREGRTRAQVQQTLSAAAGGHGESSRELMRQLFPRTPVIYGFGSAAPLGEVAGPVLDRHLRAGGAAEFASGRVSRRLIESFSVFGMTSAAGVAVGATEPPRRDVCEFADDRRSIEDRLAFVQRVVRGPMKAVGMHLDRIARLTDSLGDAPRPEVLRARRAIAGDVKARERFLSYARSQPSATVTVRMLDVARGLGWLTPVERHLEVAHLLERTIAREALGLSEVDMACIVNRSGEFDAHFAGSARPRTPASSPAHAAARACLGSAEARANLLLALAGTDELDAQIAQVYLRHRPITDAAELRRLAEKIVAMPNPDSQVLALDTLARRRIADTALPAMLTELFPRTPSAEVQNTIAGILIRAEREKLPKPELLRVLREHRLPQADGRTTLVDALIESLQRPAG